MLPLSQLHDIVDWSWCRARLGGNLDPRNLGAFLARFSAANCPVLNPLIDFTWVAERYLGDAAKVTASEVAAYLLDTLIPFGLSPHPVIDGDLVRLCAPWLARDEEAGRISSWVAGLLQPGFEPRAIIPILDSSYVASALGLAGLVTEADDLTPLQLYFGEALPRGITPHPEFDPIFVYTERTGHYPTPSELADPVYLLSGELRAYLAHAQAGKTKSPSALFDEMYYRDTHAQVRRAISAGHVLNGFHFRCLFDTNRALRATPSGIDLFRSNLGLPWQDRRRLPARAGRSAPDALPAMIRTLLTSLRQSSVPEVHAVIEGHIPREVSRGANFTFIVHGFAVSPHGRIKHVELSVGETSTTEPFQGYPRPDVEVGTLVNPADQLCSGFSLIWSGRLDQIGIVPVRLSFTVYNGKEISPSASVQVGEIVVPRPTMRHLRGSPPLVTIAMATFDPDHERFEQQIQSIRDQTLSDWRLLISDESRSAAARERIAQLAESDARIEVRHGRRVGVVGNFERAVYMADLRAPYLAFSDQDDVWYREKLEILVRTLDAGGPDLAYGDMRIVNEKGEVLSNSFFSWRRRHTHTVDALLTANVVPGAALVVRSDLIRPSLPFPNFTGLIHDMWIALSAARRGGIAFVDRPLQDYVQHDSNVIGHSDESYRLGAASSRAQTRLLETILNLDVREAQGEAAQRSLATAVATIAPTYRIELLRRMLLAKALDYRFSIDDPSDHREHLDRAALVGRLMRVPEAEDERLFLNVGPWLAAGEAAFSALRDHPQLNNVLSYLRGAKRGTFPTMWERRRLEEQRLRQRRARADPR
ncbi:glycosyltransferase [Methylobacterium hispanicum]|uniref:glycosyltransferase n=1 Tax=Methylobacterium hispanicum TaxID=270350 RepID=UPI002F31CC0C